MKMALRAWCLAALTVAVSGAHAQDAQAGSKKAAQCIGCHGIPGYQATFPEVYKVPMISGQNAAYLASALKAYQKGERKHPTMRGIAQPLSEQDIADLAAYYASHEVKSVKGPVPEPTAEVAALLKRANCGTCHGPDFNKPLDAAYPKLAGQHPDYLLAALKAYQVDGNPTRGRNNAIMSGMVKQYTADELKKMADYIGRLPSDLSTVSQSRFR